MIEHRGHKIEATGNCIVIDNKAIKVVSNNEYRFKINSKSISANGGANGLLEWMESVVKSGFGTAWIDAIIKASERM